MKFTKNQSSFIIIAVLLILTLIAFLPVRNNSYVWDDTWYIIQNRQVRQGLTADNIKWAFTTFYQANWHPLTWLSHMIDVDLFGLYPGGHHLVNMAIHMANSLLLFLALKWMTGSFWGAAAASFFFALHPTRVESVAWVSERKDVLSAFFWILSMWIYAIYARKPSFYRYSLILAAFVLGLMAKPMLVTLPFVFLLLDLWPLGRTPLWPPLESTVTYPQYEKASYKRLLLEKLPFLGVSAASSFITFRAQSSAGAVAAIEKFTILTRLQNSLVSYIKYFLMVFWPINLSPFYPHPGNNLPFWKAILSALLLLTITSLILKQVRTYPYATVGWLWYMGTLIPVIGLVQVGDQALAVRYTYLPFIGIFVILAWSLADIMTSPRQKKGLLVVLLCLSLAMVGVTRGQLPNWRDELTLFRYSLEVTDNNWLAHNNIGSILYKQKDLPGAFEHLSRTIEIRPNVFQAHNNLGLVKKELGLMDEALVHLETALEIKKDYKQAHNNIGRVYHEQGMFEKALYHYQEAIKLDPSYADAYNNLGGLLAAMGKIPEAMESYKKASSLDSNFRAISYYQMAENYYIGGRFQEALKAYEKAISIKPDYPEALFGLSLTYLRFGDRKAAKDIYKIILGLDPYSAQKLLEIIDAG